MSHYRKKDKERTIQYIKENLKRLEVRYQRDEYEQHIRPAIEKSGLPTATFIRQAIEEKIDRDQLR